MSKYNVSEFLRQVMGFRYLRMGYRGIAPREIWGFLEGYRSNKRNSDITIHQSFIANMDGVNLSRSITQYDGNCFQQVVFSKNHSSVDISFMPDNPNFFPLIDVRDDYGDGKLEEKIKSKTSQLSGWTIIMYPYETLHRSQSSGKPSHAYWNYKQRFQAKAL